MAHRIVVTLCALGLCPGSLLHAQEPAVDAPPAANVSLTGRVVAADGTPIAEAAVAFAPVGDFTAETLLERAPVRTAADGRFALTVAEVPVPVDDPEQRLVLTIAQKGFASIVPNIAWSYADPPGASPRRRQNTDVGDLVLPAGVRMFGRVRDGEGRPIADALVVARDLLDGSQPLQGPSSNAVCRARSDAGGIVRLPTTLPNAVAIEISAPGFRRQSLAPIAVGSPLEITLVRGGECIGRVLDADGRGVAGARVSAAYERSGPTTPVFTGIDGSFRLPIEYAGRYRLRATTTTKDKSRTALSGTTDVLDGPVANLELPLAISKETGDPNERLRVQIVADATGEPIVGGRAAAVWHDYANRNAGYLEYCFEVAMRGVQPVTTNEVEVAGPGPKISVGAVRASAPGFAPATQRDVEWVTVKDGEVRPPLVLRLVPEATIRGTVVDERTNAPIAGARVWARKKLDGQTYNVPGDEIPHDAPTTGADGAFTLRQLGEGTWSVTFRHPKRPKCPTAPVTLAAAEQRVDLTLSLPPGESVGGRVTGAQLPAGCKVFLHPIPNLRFEQMGLFSGVQQSSTLPAQQTMLAADGSFAIDGVAHGHFMLVLVLPSPPRLGGSLALPIEPLRVRPGGVQRDFDASLDAPARLTGRVTFARAEIPFDRLVVVAQAIDPDNNSAVFYTNRQLNGPRSFVAADGTFALGVVSGTHHLHLVDMATRLIVASTTEPQTVKPGGTATRDLAAALTEVAVRLVPEADGKPMALVDRLEVRLQPKSEQNAGQRVVFAAGNDNHDFGSGMPVPDGVSAVTLQLPEGQATLFARNGIAALRVDDNRHQNPPLARDEFEVVAEPRREIALKVGPPPEIPAKDAKPAAGAEKK